MSQILVVEDNELNREMLSRRLSRRGYTVVCAVNGEEALAMARARLPDLIIMDIRLPDMSGCQVTRMLKSEPDTRHIPVVALSAHAMDAHRQEAISAGCDDYDTKPVDIERLVGKMRALLIGSVKESWNSGEMAA
jgi:CheY-like chemotaxis protein